MHLTAYIKHRFSFIETARKRVKNKFQFKNLFKHHRCHRLNKSLRDSKKDEQTIVEDSPTFDLNFQMLFSIPLSYKPQNFLA
jgi:hypothetical protein